MPQTMPKVTALITRQTDAGMHDLLVFRHPTAGVQLPAGTVEAGESMETAVLREAAEESGLTDITLIKHLYTQTQDLGETRRALMRTMPLLSGPSTETNLLNLTFNRGAWFRVIDEVDAFSEVVYEEYDLDVEPHKVRIRFSGWLPTDALATRMERQFFHLVSTSPTPETWEHLAEDRHLFKLYWTPLKPRPRLVEGQDEWLDWVYAGLLESVGEGPV